MPFGRTPQTTYLTDEDKKLLATALSELSARGLEVNTQVIKDTKSIWSSDENDYFISKDGRRFNPLNVNQKNFIDSQARFVALISGRGGGKALWVETPILTVNKGWTTMGELRIGDIVFDEKGNPVPIDTVSEVMYGHKCYKVTLSDHSSIIADAEHLWFTQTKKERNGEVKSTGKVRTTEEMISNLTIGKVREANYSIPTCLPLQYPETTLPLDPYILGCWLGDGHSRGARFTTNDVEILDEFKKRGVHSKKTFTKYDYGICFPDTGNLRDAVTGRMMSNPFNLVSILRELDVLNNKHIPAMYKIASYRQRLELLQGLMDTDGTCDTRGHSSFEGMSKTLCEDVLELCIGMGIKATITEGRAMLYDKYCGEDYTIYINTYTPIFKLPRHLARLNNCKKQANRHTNRFIKSIEKVESVPVKCIGVDSPSHLYLAGKNLIPTHNTASGAQKAMRKIKEGKSGTVINPDFENFKLSTWTEFQYWIDWSQVVPSQRYRANPEWQPHQPFTMVFLNGVTVYCKGLKDPNSARGANVNWLWYDEGGRDETGLGWRIANASVRVGENPQSWVTATPRGRDHWLYRFFVKKEFTKEVEKILKESIIGREVIQIYFSSIEANKVNLSPDFYAAMLANYPAGWLREQELEGKFVDEGATMGDKNWFMGKEIPFPLGADMIKSSVRYWDLAASEKKLFKKRSDDPDSTVGTRLAQAITGNFYIEDIQHVQASWSKIKEIIVNTALQDGVTVPIYIEQEPGSGGINQVAEIASIPELSAWTVRGHNPRDLGDKVMRAQSWFAKAQIGLVWYVKGEYVEDLMSQIGSFPSAKHDDFVDSISGAFACLAPVKRWSRPSFLAIR